LTTLKGAATIYALNLSTLRTTLAYKDTHIASLQKKLAEREAQLDGLQFEWDALRDDYVKVLNTVTTCLAMGKSRRAALLEASSNPSDAP